jgi:hypothetical protein
VAFVDRNAGVVVELPCSNHYGEMPDCFPDDVIGFGFAEAVFRNAVTAVNDGCERRGRGRLFTPSSVEGRGLPSPNRPVCFESWQSVDRSACPRTLQTPPSRIARNTRRVRSPPRVRSKAAHVQEVTSSFRGDPSRILYLPAQRPAANGHSFVMDRLIDLNPRDAEPVNAMSCKRQSSRHSYLMSELEAEHQGEFPVGEGSCFGSGPYFPDPS